MVLSMPKRHCINRLKLYQSHIIDHRDEEIEYLNLCITDHVMQIILLRSVPKYLNPTGHDSRFWSDFADFGNYRSL